MEKGGLLPLEILDNLYDILRVDTHFRICIPYSDGTSTLCSNSADAVILIKTQRRQCASRIWF